MRWDETKWDEMEWVTWTLLTTSSTASQSLLDGSISLMNYFHAPAPRSGRKGGGIKQSCNPFICPSFFLFVPFPWLLHGVPRTTAVGGISLHCAIPCYVGPLIVNLIRSSKDTYMPSIRSCWVKRGPVVGSWWKINKSRNICAFSVWDGIWYFSVGSVHNGPEKWEVWGEVLQGFVKEISAYFVAFVGAFGWCFSHLGIFLVGFQPWHEISKTRSSYGITIVQSESHLILGGGVAVCLLLSAHRAVIFAIAQLFVSLRTT